MDERGDALKEQAVRNDSVVYSVGVEDGSSEDFPTGFKQTEVGLIPDDWEVKKLGDHVKFLRNGTNPRAELTSSGNVKYLHYGDIHTSFRCYLDPEMAEMPCLPEGLANRLDRLKSGDLIFTDASEDMEGVGKSIELKIESEREVVAGLHTIAARFDKSVLVDGFKAYLQFCPVFREHLRSLAAGTKVYATTRSHIASAAVPLPKAFEQRAIATALSDADALIESLDRLIAKKRAIKQATMQQLLTGQTRLPGFTGEWETKRLGEVAEIRSGGTPSTTTPSYWGGGIAWCTPTDITALEGGKYLSETARTISESGLSSSSAEIIPRNSVIMTSRATIGECAINKAPTTTNQGFKNLVPKACETEFLYYIMSTQKGRLIELCAGSTFLELGAKQLRIFEVHMPTDQAEREAIATILTDMDTEIEAMEHRRDKVRQVKQGMMQQLLTGQVRLVEPGVAV